LCSHLFTLNENEAIGGSVANAARFPIAVGIKMFAIWTGCIVCLPVMFCVPVLISLAAPVFVTLSISVSIRIAASGVIRPRYRRWRRSLGLRHLRRRTSGTAAKIR
jgi:hypothetical protein